MSKNDITGDTIKTKAPSKEYDEGWERIFGKKDKLSQVFEDASTQIKRQWKESGAEEAWDSYKEANPLCTVCGNCLKDVLACNKNSCPKNEET